MLTRGAANRAPFRERARLGAPSRGCSSQFTAAGFLQPRANHRAGANGGAGCASGIRFLAGHLALQRDRTL